MNYFKYLKSRFPFYIISGTVFSLLVFSLVLLNRYNGYLSGTLGDMESINVKKIRVREYIREIDSLEVYFRDNFGMEVIDRNSEKFLFQAIDDLKAHMQDAVVTVTKFEKSNHGKELPVEILAPMKNYKMVTDYIGYIESFKIPDFKIRNISVSRDQSGNVMLGIKGSFIMPV